MALESTEAKVSKPLNASAESFYPSPENGTNIGLNSSTSTLKFHRWTRHSLVPAPFIPVFHPSVFPLHPPTIACYNAFSQPVVGNLYPRKLGFEASYYWSDQSATVEEAKGGGILEFSPCGKRGKKGRRWKGLKKFASQGLQRERVWSIKKMAPVETTGRQDGVVPDIRGKTSLMIRNIPNQIQRDDLMRILDKHCRKENEARHYSDITPESAYDFLYLPMDFMRRANLGYAFVNFTSYAGAEKFCKAFHKYEWEVPANKKVCEISFAKYQGKDELKGRFENSRFPCDTSDYLPVVLSPPRNGLSCPSRPTLVGRCTGMNVYEIRLQRRSGSIRE